MTLSCETFKCFARYSNASPLLAWILLISTLSITELEKIKFENTLLQQKIQSEQIKIENEILKLKELKKQLEAQTEDSSDKLSNIKSNIKSIKIELNSPDEESLPLREYYIVTDEDNNNNVSGEKVQ